MRRRAHKTQAEHGNITKKVLLMGVDGPEGRGPGKSHLFQRLTNPSYTSIASIPKSDGMNMGTFVRGSENDARHRLVNVTVYDAPSYKDYKESKDEVNLSDHYCYGMDMIAYVVDCTVSLDEQLEKLRAMHQKTTSLLADKNPPLKFILIMTKMDDRLHQKITRENVNQIQTALGGVESVCWVSAQVGELEQIDELSRVMANELYGQHLEEVKETEAPVLDIRETTKKEIEGYFQTAEAAFTTKRSEKNSVDVLTWNFTRESREEFSKLLTQARKNIVGEYENAQAEIKAKEEDENLQGEYDKEEIDPNHALAFAKAASVFAPKVADCTLTDKDLNDFNKAIEPILSQHTKTGRIAGRMSAAAVGCLIGVGIGALFGPAAPLAIPIAAGIGFLVGTVVGWSPGGEIGNRAHLAVSPHHLFTLKKSAQKVRNDKEASLQQLANTPRRSSSGGE